MPRPNAYPRALRVARRRAEEISVARERAALAVEVAAQVGLTLPGILALETNGRSAIRGGADRERKLLTSIQKMARNEVRQIEAMFYLASRVSPRALMPPSGRWAMDARSIAHLVDIVTGLGSVKILELGSGTTTVWLGYLAEQNNCQVISIDHDERFADLTRGNLQRHGLDGAVEVRTAPLVSSDQDGGKAYNWYDHSHFSDVTDIGLLIVDGPPGTIGLEARAPAVTRLHDQLSTDAVIVLDDIDRPDEAAIAERWAEQYELDRLDEDVSGLAVLRRR